MAEPAAQQGDHRLSEREQQRQRQQIEQRRETRRDQHGAELVAGAETLGICGLSCRECLAVSHPGIGNRQHPRSRQLCPEAQVHVFAVVGHLGIEPFEAPEQVGAYQDARRGHREDVDHGVVLLLVDLSGFHDVGGYGEAVDDVGDMLQPVGIVPFEELRADDPGVGTQRLDHEQPHRVRFGGDVVVADHQEHRVNMGIEERVRRGREAVCVRGIEHRRLGQESLHPSGHGRVARGVHHHDLKARIVLRGEALQGVFEPVAGGVGDDHRKDRRGRVPRARLVVTTQQRLVRTVCHNRPRLPASSRSPVTV